MVALYALGPTWAVFMLTGLLFVATALSYAEATAMFPEAGGSSSFARHTFNEFVSFVAGWALMLDYIITIAISAFFVPHYLAAFWPVLKVHPWDSVGGIVTIVVLVGINIVGIKEAARLNIVLAILDLSTQVLLALVGLFVLLSPRLLISQIHLGVAPTWHQFIYGISIGTVAYTGIETVSNMAEEAANPARDAPRSIKFVLLAVLGVYAAVSLVALSAMPVKYNTLPVNTAKGQTEQVAVVPAKSSEPGGPYVFQANPKEPVYVPVTQSGSTFYTTPQSPTGKVFSRDGQEVTNIYGSQLGSVYLQDPVQGIVAHLPANLGWLKAFLKPGSVSSRRLFSSLRPMPASSVCRGSPTRWPATSSYHPSSPACIPPG